MLPTFVIGLREGLEAALIVGIIAAFLKQQGRRDLLVKVWLGVALAGVLCLAVGIGLQVLSADLPQKQQEGLETVIGAIAVGMVTYMVVWMRRHSRNLKKQLEGAASSALAAGSGLALVAMAFLAVLREGFETAVFLVAAFNNSANPAQAGAGAVLGVLVAVALGYGIFRGGVRINLSKFFRFTGFVLVLVAAGLVVSALHTAHEAGWLNIGQSRTVDLTWLVQPGSVQSSLLTGMLGLQPRPVIIELIGWLLYLVPLGLYVAWPPGRAVPHRAIQRIGAGTAAAAAAAAVVLTIVMPGAVATPASSSFATSAAPLTVSGPGGASGDTLTAAVTQDGKTEQWQLGASGTTTVGDRAARVFRQDRVVANPAGLPATISLAQLVKANGGHLPLGANASSESATVPVTYTTTDSLTLTVDQATGRALNVSRTDATTMTATLSIGPTTVGAAQSTTTQATPAAVSRAAAQAATADQTMQRRQLVGGYRTAALILAFVAAAVAVGSWTVTRRRRVTAEIPTATAVRAPSKASLS